MSQESVYQKGSLHWIKVSDLSEVLNLTLNPIQEQPTLYDFSMALRFVITILMTPPR